MLMTEARLYLIDEPSLGLAPKISHRVMEALWDLPVTGAMIIAEQNVQAYFKTPCLDFQSNFIKLIYQA